MPGDVLEGLGQLGAGLQALGCFGEFGFECSQLHGEVGFLFGEEVGADLPGVVEVEQLATPFPEIVSERRSRAVPPTGSRPGNLPQLCPDRLLERLITPNQAQTQHRCPFQTLDRAPRLLAALAPMDAPEEPAALPVPIDTGDTATQPTAHDTRQRVAALAAPALDPTPLCPFPLGLGDDRFMVAGEPLALPGDFTEVDAGLQDAPCRRVA